MAMKRLLFILLMAGVSSAPAVFAQDGQLQTNYSSLAQQLIYSSTNGDANASVLPSVAVDNGIGSYLDNPASMALINMSYFNAGLESGITDQTNAYLGNESIYNDSKVRFGNMGLIYQVPTERGTLVVGGGYTLNNSFNRTNLFSGLNTQSTITDVFKRPESDYYDIAFETYATDWGDVDQTFLESIFRIGFAPGNFPGIYQDGEISQQGSVGEYSVFLSTEFQRNIYAGISLGLEYGTFDYQRNFLESDLDNVYDGDFIEQDGAGNGGTDIDNILLYDEINSEIIGANLIAGVLYKILPNLNIGGSVKIPSKLAITEDYFSEITTNFDDGRSPFFDNFEGNFSYSVRRPFQWNAGIAIDNYEGFTLSGSVEFIDYSNTEVDLTSRSSDNLDFTQIAALREQENLIREQIQQDYNQVLNLKAGLKYQFISGFEIRGGYAFLPGKSSLTEADRTIFSGGLGVPLTRELYLDITGQYSEWNDRSLLYQYEDPVNGDLMSESISEDFSRINILVGFKYRF